MTSPTPSEFAAAMAKAGCPAHPNVVVSTVIFKDTGRVVSEAAYRHVDADGEDDWRPLSDSDALDLLAAWAWRWVREKWRIQQADFRMGSSEKIVVNGHSYFLDDDHAASLSADPANVYALLRAIGESNAKA